MKWVAEKGKNVADVISDWELLSGGAVFMHGMKPMFLWSYPVQRVRVEKTLLLVE